MNAFFVRAEFGRYADAFFKNGYVAIGWFDEPAIDYSQKDLITKNYIKQFPASAAGNISQNVGQIYRFWNEIKEEDIVVTTYTDGSLLIGIVKGKPYFKKDDTCPFNERINVKWIQHTFNRSEFSIPAQKTIRSSLTVFKISQAFEFAKLAGIKISDRINDNSDTDKTLITEQIIYEAIKKQLLNLSDSEFEIFVAFILQSLGFVALQKRGKVGDGGVDFEGVLDVLGVSSIRLQVQVKQYSKTSISEMDIRNFRGALKKDHQGTFITLSVFQKKAIESAADINKVAINLIDGKKLIEIFIEQYDKVIQLIEDDANTELLQKLKFRKVIIPQ